MERYTKTISVVLFCFVISLAAIAPVVLAQDATSQPAPQDKPVAQTPSVWDLIVMSGAIGYFICLLSVVSTAMIIEQFVTLRRDKMIPPDLLQDIEDLFGDENYEDVMETCAAEPGYLTNVIGAALPRMENGHATMLEAARAASEEEAVKMFQKLSWLQLIGSMAPMLGLLGTVQGMIVSFSQIAAMEGAPKPKDLAEGIYLALVTTVQGLIVAIPALFGYFFFRNKIVRLSMEINGVTEELLDRFRDKK